MATQPILRVGLTGGIASGKTTVTEILAGLGAFTVDADRLAHRTMQPGGSAHAEVVRRFGPSILDEAGRIDRGRLGALVFHDAPSRQALNAIVHPRVREAFELCIENYRPEGHAPVVVFDAALLVESGGWRDFHRLIVTACSHDSQLRRLLARDGIRREEAEARIAAQAPLEQKIKVADYVIDTDSTLRETRRQTREVYEKLLIDFEERFGDAKFRP